MSFAPGTQLHRLRGHCVRAAWAECEIAHSAHVHRRGMLLAMRYLTCSALLVVLGLASLLPTSPAAAQTGRAAQVLDPTLQALATEAALAVTQAALIPTPDPTDFARAVTNAGGITIQGTLNISGAAQISGTYTTQLLNVGGIRPDVVSCASFAQGMVNPDGTGFGVPGPGLATTVSGHAVLIPTAVSPYPGPGQYIGEQAVQLGAGVVIDNTNYLVADGPQDYDVTVNPDGSGSFTFRNLHAGSLATGTVSAATISGSDVWSCSPQP
jgi:hypothetical protein